MALSEKVLSLFDDPRYAKIAVENSSIYSSIEPFPHISIDNFLPDEIADKLYQDFPVPDAYCRVHSNQNTSRSFQDNTSLFKPDLRLFALAIASREFILFLEKLTGIDCLIPDPYMIGGGAMMSGKGDFLKIHQDFNWHHKLQLHRRVNALFYLSPDWLEEYGGELELWDNSKPVKKIAPKFNRVVVFNTPNANHGQPHKLDIPDNIYRRVFSAFYYTSRANDDIWKDPHFTKYLPSNSEYGAKLLETFSEKSTY
jgi:Rps23 Pro-64 3,4-dihydroxylase Tpa1-like proline 4-hydroxylase